MIETNSQPIIPCPPSRESDSPTQGSLKDEVPKLNGQTRNAVKGSTSAIIRRSRTRTVEVGSFPKIKQMNVIIYHERFPVWLLLLESLLAPTISICGSKDMRCFEEKCMSATQCSLGFIQNLVQRMGTSKFRFEQDYVGGICNALILVSGSLQYIKERAAKIHDPMLFVLDRNFSGRLRQGVPSGTNRASVTHIRWHRLQHRVLGGSTDFVALAGTVGQPLQVETSTLRRTIRDVFSSGIRPKGLRNEEISKMLAMRNNGLKQHFYVLDDTLEMSDLQRSVHHPTDFYATGWGTRVLTTAELGAAFGYPRAMYELLEPWIFAYPPLSVLLALYRGMVTDTESHMSGFASLKESNVSLKAFNGMSLLQDEMDKTWVAALNKWLPHTWAGTSEKLKSSKRDDALAPVHLWNNRIVLLIPSAESLVDLLRTLCLQRLRRRLLMEFIRYLRNEYGVEWCLLLNELRQQGFQMPQSPELELKRVGGEIVKDTLGTSDNEKKNKKKNTYHREGRRVCMREQCNDAQLLEDITLGIDILRKMAECTWWDWSSGSSLIFWRWNRTDWTIVKEGMPPFIQGELPKWKVKRSKRPQEPKCTLIVQKLKTIVDRGYVQQGIVKSWTEFFDVPKGEDIRLVYNGTSCGLNQALWSPSFWLPFPKSACSLLSYNYFSGDIDLGEMFLNFPLHKQLQEYSGIDLTVHQKELELPSDATTNYRWTRNWMGARSSPYSSVRFYYIAEEFCRGDRTDLTNALRWDLVKLNLPGDISYNPSLPRVQKWDGQSNRLAGDIITFVDDGRITGQTLEHAWLIMHQICSRFQFLGMQVALRKVYEPKRKPGPWAGALFETTETSVTKSVTNEKWIKGKMFVERLWAQLEHVDWASRKLSYKELEIMRGYLGHLSMTFEVLVPYLKGFHLTLASHLNRRDREGWKYTDKAWKVYVDHKVEEGLLTEEEGTRMVVGNPYTGESPQEILPVAQLKDDVYALREFFKEDTPPIIQERCSHVHIVRYGFGDASGSGFGSTIQTKHGLRYRIGVWGSDDDDESSNFKELENVVTTVELEAQSDRGVRTVQRKLYK